MKGNQVVEIFSAPSPKWVESPTHPKMVDREETAWENL